MKNNAPFDRENEYFADYIVPQIQIRLALRCDLATRVAATTQNISKFTENVWSDEILYSRSVTLLNIIIIDENDNWPVFTNPTNFDFHIGFPEAEIIEKLKPQNLIQVTATDRDEGLNAKIRFSLDAYGHFNIDPETGVMYPMRNFKVDEDSVTVTVQATDRDGDSDGNTQNTSLIVHKVKAENVVQIMALNVKLENVESLIAQQLQDTRMEARIISFFAVPADETLTSKQASVNGTNVVVYIYAFNNTNTRSLLHSNDIVDILNNLSMADFATFATFNDINYKPSDCNLTGLVVAVSVLGGLLLIVSIGTPLVWFLWLRYKIKGSSRRNSEISQKKLEEEEEDDRQSNSTPTPAEIVEATIENEITRSDAEVIGIMIDGVTQGKVLLQGSLLWQ